MCRCICICICVSATILSIHMYMYYISLSVAVISFSFLFILVLRLFRNNRNIRWHRIGIGTCDVLYWVGSSTSPPAFPLFLICPLDSSDLLFVGRTIGLFFVRRSAVLVSSLCGFYRCCII